jgi:hypothetical protein
MSMRLTHVAAPADRFAAMAERVDVATRAVASRVMFRMRETVGAAASRGGETDAGVALPPSLPHSGYPDHADCRVVADRRY